jgi:co-chaperonin GroES (HSP10)
VATKSDKIMTTSFEARQMQVRPLPADILVYDMDMGEQTTASGIVIQSDDGKAHGVKPRWAKVYKVGERCVVDVNPGQWILIEHGRWTRKIKIDDGDSIKEVQKVEVSAIMAVTDERPTGIHIGQEFSNGSSMNISPEDFMPGNMAKFN